MKNMARFLGAILPLELSSRGTLPVVKLLLIQSSIDFGAESQVVLYRK